MRIFSERYGFKLKMKSQRCRLLPDDSDACNGYIEKCLHSGKSKDCLESGGTTVTVVFKSADRQMADDRGQKTEDR
jgi:hypothetical protein